MLEWLTELRKTVYLPDAWFITKDTNEQPDKEIHRVRSRRVLSTGASVPGESGVCHPLAYAVFLFTNLEVLGTLSFRSFMEASLHRHD